MTSTKPKLAVVFISGLMLLTSVIISCNNGDSDKKDAGADTPTKIDAPPPSNMPDTMKMDTADTRPVKTTD